MLRYKSLFYGVIENKDKRLAHVTVEEFIDGTDLQGIDDWLIDPELPLLREVNMKAKKNKTNACLQQEIYLVRQLNHLQLSMNATNFVLLFV